MVRGGTCGRGSPAERRKGKEHVVPETPSGVDDSNAHGGVGRRFWWDRDFPANYQFRYENPNF
jgi:hypothetical protein